MYNGTKRKQKLYLIINPELYNNKYIYLVYIREDLTKYLTFQLKNCHLQRPKKKKNNTNEGTKIFSDATYTENGQYLLLRKLQSKMTKAQSPLVLSFDSH